MKISGKKIIITSVCFIIVGIILTTIGFAFGGRSGFQISKKGIQPLSTSSKTYSLPKTKLNSFSNANLSMDYGNIDILPSEDQDYYIEYLMYENSGEPYYEVNNDTLSVKQNNNTSISFMIFGFSDIVSTPNQPYMRLYVPKGRLNELILNNESGTTTMDGINIENAALDITYGELNIKNSFISSLTFESESTEIDLKDSEIKTFDISGSYGKLSLNNFTCESAIINLESCDVNLYASKLEHLDYSNEYGNLILRLPESTNKYDFDIFLEYGDIVLPNDASGTVNYDEDGNQVYTAKGSGTNTIKITSESGDVRIENRE